MNKALLFCHLNPMQHLYQKKKQPLKVTYPPAGFRHGECMFALPIPKPLRGGPSGSVSLSGAVFF